MSARISNVYRISKLPEFKRFLCSQITDANKGSVSQRILRSDVEFLSIAQCYPKIRASSTAVRWYTSSDGPKRQKSLPDVNQLLSTISHISHTNTLQPAIRIVKSGKSIFDRKWNSFWVWYDEVSHTNEVRDAHKHVEELQEKLNQVQQLRREVSKELNDIRYKLQLCYADLANCQKGEPRYLELIRKEYEVNK